MATVIVAVLLVVAAFVATYVLLARGSLTVDLGVGRSLHPLGPMTVRIQAPRELVFEVISAPYLRTPPAELRGKIQVLERGEGLVLASHRTKVRGFTTVTVETVRFTPPERVDFRLLRGPVPYVVEHFMLHDVSGVATELEYGGELGADLWVLGRWWGRRVARIWDRAVATSLEGIRAAAEERAGRGHDAPGAPSAGGFRNETDRRA